jgi:hypothetical protein
MTYFVNIAYATSTVTAPTNIITSASDVVNLFCGALNWMFWGLIVVGVGMFLYGGYLYATSAGEADKVGQANKTLLYAAIAIVVALVAQGVPPLIANFLGSTVSLGVCP